MEVPNMQTTRVTLSKYFVGVAISLMVASLFGILTYMILALRDLMREAQARQEAE
jgi:hypothetical protein